MKIAGKIIQNRSITTSTKNDFLAKYKGHQISITTDHVFGKPDFKHLKRFNIEVTNINTGGYVVDTYKYFHDIKSAIGYELKGALL